MLSVKQNLVDLRRTRRSASPRARATQVGVWSSAWISPHSCASAPTPSREARPAQAAYGHGAACTGPPCSSSTNPPWAPTSPRGARSWTSVREIAARAPPSSTRPTTSPNSSDLEADVAMLHEGRIALEGQSRRRGRPRRAIGRHLTSGARPDATWLGRRRRGRRWRPFAGVGALDAPPLAQARPRAVLADALGRLGPATKLDGIDVTPASLETAFLAVTGHHSFASMPTESRGGPDVVHA